MCGRPQSQHRVALAKFVATFFHAMHKLYIMKKRVLHFRCQR